MPRQDNDISRMLRTNLRQKEHYETKNPHIETGRAATHIWARARRSMQRMRTSTGIQNDVLNLHREWLGDLAGKKVLDLGCFSGNPLSMHLARNSGSYLGLDLSEQATAQLDAELAKLRAAGLPNARAVAGDFLSPRFDESEFNVVYAQSVLHHFEHLDAMLEVLHAKLAPGGVVVTWDPMQTSPPVWAARKLYRPLQSDKDWEFPFTRETFGVIQKRFIMERVQGILGRSKWAFLAMPLGADRAARLARRWHERDLRRATEPGPDLWRCMQVTMKLRRRDAVA